MFLNEMMKKNKGKTILGATALLVCIGLIAVYPASASSTGKGEQGIYKETPVVLGDVTVGISESGTANLEAIAITYDDYSSSSSSGDSDNNTVKALVEEVYVKAGQKVAVGDPIAKISTEDISANLDELQQSRKEALLGLEKAKLDQESGAISAKKALDQRLHDAENADLNYELALDENDGSVASLRAVMQNALERKDIADSDMDDYEALNKQYPLDINAKIAEIAEVEAAGGDVSGLREELAKLQADFAEYRASYTDTIKKLRSEYSAAANAYSAAKLKYEVAVNGQSLAESNAESDKTTALSYQDNAQQLYDLEIAQLANAVSSRTLTLENLDKSIAKLEGYITDGQVKATCDGLIMNVYVVAGDKVSANDTLASIANSKNIYMGVSIDQEDIATLELGRAANIELDAYPDKKITGKVDSISVTPAMGSNSSTVSYKVKVKLDTGDESIYEGMTGSVIFVSEQVTNVLTVSSKSIYAENGSLYVKVKNADGTITPKPVETGLTNGVVTEIKSGLAEGDIAIIESKVKAK